MAMYLAPLIKKEEEAEGTLTYHLERPRDFEYLAGQHVVMKLAVLSKDPREGFRTFSLASSPTEPVLKLTMRHGPAPSLFKQTLFNLPLGTPVTLFGPTGRFVLHEDPKIPAVMIAGGIGIAPFRSMLKYLVDARLHYRVILLYSNPTAERIAFKDEFDSMAKENGNFTIVYTLTETPSAGWKGTCGRIDARFIKLRADTLRNPVYYICGTPEMVTCIDTILQGELNTPRDRIRFERFTGYTPPPTET